MAAILNLPTIKVSRLKERAPTELVGEYPVKVDTYIKENFKEGVFTGMASDMMYVNISVCCDEIRADVFSSIKDVDFTFNDRGLSIQDETWSTTIMWRTIRRIEITGGIPDEKA